ERRTARRSRPRGVLLKRTQAERNIARRILDHIVGLVPRKIERDRGRRIHTERDRILSGREELVAVMFVLAWLGEDRLLDGEIRKVTGGTAGLLKEKAAAVDGLHFIFGERRKQAQRGELGPRGGARLRRHIDRQTRHVTDR